MLCLIKGLKSQNVNILSFRLKIVLFEFHPEYVGHTMSDIHVKHHAQKVNLLVNKTYF